MLVNYTLWTLSIGIIVEGFYHTRYDVFCSRNGQSHEILPPNNSVTITMAPSFANAGFVLVIIIFCELIPMLGTYVRFVI